jgi:abequosyltransferase
LKTLLNISIPTYNRPEFLYKCIKSIHKAISQLNENDRKLVSIYVSDNSEDYKSKNITNLVEFESLNIIYFKNLDNIGSDKNIARCYLYDNADYVMILGDDDFISVNSLSIILPFLKAQTYPIIFLKAYGLTNQESQSRSDFLKGIIEYKSFYEVLMARNIHLAFISNMIFRRSDYSESIVHEGIGSNLVQFNLVLYLLSSWNGKCVSLNANLVMSTRNNTGGYDPIDIFGKNFFNIIEKYFKSDPTVSNLFVLKKRLLHTFYNRSLAQFMQKTGKVLTKSNLQTFDNWYSKSLSYSLFYRPLFLWNSKFSFYMLTTAYLFGNLYYSPKTKTGDFLYHFKTHIRLKF